MYISLKNFKNLPSKQGGQAVLSTTYFLNNMNIYIAGPFSIDLRDIYDTSCSLEPWSVAVM